MWPNTDRTINHLITKLSLYYKRRTTTKKVTPIELIQHRPQSTATIQWICNEFPLESVVLKLYLALEISQNQTGIYFSAGSSSQCVALALLWPENFPLHLFLPIFAITFTLCIRFCIIVSRSTIRRVPQDNVNENGGQGVNGWGRLWEGGGGEGGDLGMSSGLWPRHNSVYETEIRLRYGHSISGRRFRVLW